MKVNPCRGLESNGMGADPSVIRGRQQDGREGNRREHWSLPIGVERAARTHRERAQHGKPLVASQRTQPESREGQAGSQEVSERLIVSTKPGNAGGEKEPWFLSVSEGEEGEAHWR